MVVSVSTRWHQALGILFRESKAHTKMQSSRETSLNKAIVQVKEILSRLAAGLKMKILKGPIGVQEKEELGC